VPIGVVKTGGASGNNSNGTPGANRHPGEFRVVLAGGLHRHVKKAFILRGAGRITGTQKSGLVRVRCAGRKRRVCGPGT